MKITEENFIYCLKQKNEEALKYFIVNYSSMIRKTVNKILYLYPSDSEGRISRGRKKIIKNNPHLFRRSDTYEK